VTSRQRLCREQGLDFFEVAQEIAKENEFLDSKGLPVDVAPANVQITEVSSG
jgi:capsid protein